MGEWRRVDKARKKALREQYKRGERDERRKRMCLSEPQLEALLDHLEQRLERTGCDGTPRLTVEWIEGERMDRDRVLESLLELGGGCDCEVILNVDPEEIYT